MEDLQSLRVRGRVWTAKLESCHSAILAIATPCHAAAPHARAMARRMRNAHELTMMKGSNITRTDC